MVSINFHIVLLAKVDDKCRSSSPLTSPHTGPLIIIIPDHYNFASEGKKRLIDDRIVREEEIGKRYPKFSFLLTTLPGLSLGFLPFLSNSNLDDGPR